VTDGPVPTMFGMLRAVAATGRSGARERRSLLRRTRGDREAGGYCPGDERASRGRYREAGDTCQNLPTPSSTNDPGIELTVSMKRPLLFLSHSSRGGDASRQKVNRTCTWSHRGVCRALRELHDTGVHKILNTARPPQHLCDSYPLEWLRKA
jgi:hypothetical protein